jgi:hypothetical protein
VLDDLGSDLDLTPHRVDGDEDAFELFPLGQMIEQDGNGRDLVALSGTLICASVRWALVA